MYTNIHRYNLINDWGLQLNKLCCNIVLKPFSILITNHARCKSRIVEIPAVFSSKIGKKILQSLDIWMKPHDEVGEWWNMHTDWKV